MVLFRYQAMTANGAIVRGYLEAANLSDLEARLLRLGLDLVDGRQQKRRPRFGSGIARRELITFFFHLEQLVGAGIPIIDSLNDLRDSVEGPQFRAVLAAIVEGVEGGKPLSAAMAAHRHIFDPVIVSLVRAGEDSGTLPQVLADLVVSLKWQDELAAQARRLAFYPAVLAAATMGLLVFMMVYLIPRLPGFMRGMGRELPWHTEALMTVSRIVIDGWYLLLGVPIATGLAVGLTVRRNRRARLVWDSIKLRLPLIGTILRKIALARFAGVLALLYGAGIPVLDAIRTTEKIVGNAAIARHLRQAVRSISAGETIAAAFEHAQLFPSLIVRMLRVGENTGGLDKALSNVSYFFERDVREAVQRAATAIEPTIVAVIGLVIGWIMLSVLGPIYELIGSLGI